MQSFIVNNLDIIISEDQEKEHQYRRIELPSDFLQWQSLARLRSFETMSQSSAERVKSMPAHLPVLATLSKGDFPINLTTRGIGLLPRQDYLLQYCRAIEEIIVQTKDHPWQETLADRVAVIREFYQQPDHFDAYLLGGLEIFEGQTVKNLQNNPHAALLYSGEAPDFCSYQFNGVVQFIHRGDDRFRFLLAARELFARDSFHIHQINYPFGYLFYSIEVKNKTPYPRR